MDIPAYALELLLAYDGRLHYLASGFSVSTTHIRHRTGAGVTSGESPKPTTGTARRLTRAGLTHSSRWSGC
jgi:hypothetical protein